ncbi:hypothetical protein ANABIO4_25690 [Bacillus subtilis]|nr:hypothetical protein ANABIO4_25690 [Bacillus subtilis]
MLIFNRRLKLLTRKIVHHTIDAVVKMPALTDFCFENRAAEMVLITNAVTPHWPHDGHSSVHLELE